MSEVITEHGRRWGLVLAGGDGTRLQELTRLIAGAPVPKQYCRIHSDQSLLETTRSRIGPSVPPTRTLVLVNHDHLHVAREQLGGVPADNILVCPGREDVLDTIDFVVVPVGCFFE